MYYITIQKCSDPVFIHKHFIVIILLVLVVTNKYFTERRWCITLILYTLPVSFIA